MVVMMLCTVTFNFHIRCSTAHLLLEPSSVLFDGSYNLWCTTMVCGYLSCTAGVDCCPKQAMEAQMSASGMPDEAAADPACSDYERCLHNVYMSCYVRTVADNKSGRAVPGTVCIAAHSTQTDAAQPTDVTQKVLMSSPALAG